MKFVVDLKRICAYILIVFSGLCLNCTGINPIYITACLGFVLLLVLLIQNKIYFKINNSISMAIVFLLIITGIQAKGESDNSLFNVIFSVVYFIVTYTVIVSIKKEVLIKYCKYFIDFSIMLLFVEAIVRILNPSSNTLLSDNNSFYQYKYNSIMYQDSNFVGMFIIMLFFFALYLENRHNLNLKKRKMLLLLLCILTLSRAAILVIIALGFLFDKKIKKNKKILLVFIVGFGILYVLTSYMMSDASFMTKFYIIEKTFDFLVNKASWDRVLFGVGFGQSIYYLGIAAHNFFIIYIMETGIVGTLSLLIFWLFIFRESKKYVYYVMVPFLIAGLSLAPLFTPYLYCIFAIIIVLERTVGQK